MRNWINIVENNGINISYEILSPDEMWLRIRKDKTIFHRIKYLIASEIKNEILIVALINNKIVGISGMQINPYNNNEIWVKYVSVDKDYQNQGIGRKLIELTYDYSKHNNYEVILSSFTNDGELKLKHITDEYGELK